MASDERPNGDEPCVCGHTVEEHGHTFLRECEADDCRCICYEPDVETHGD